jgi:hypothetical protein
MELNCDGGTGSVKLESDHWTCREAVRLSGSKEGKYAKNHSMAICRTIAHCIGIVGLQ